MRGRQWNRILYHETCGGFRLKQYVDELGHELGHGLEVNVIGRRGVLLIERSGK